jgi:hypothetical protein
MYSTCNVHSKQPNNFINNKNSFNQTKFTTIYYSRSHNFLFEWPSILSEPLNSIDKDFKVGMPGLQRRDKASSLQRRSKAEHQTSSINEIKNRIPISSTFLIKKSTKIILSF